MKKLLLLATMIVGFGASVMAQNFNYPYSVSVTLNANGYVNMLSNACRVGQILVTGNTSTNVTLQLVDTYSGALTNFIPAFTNTVSYGTNYVWTYTNYFGVTTTLTNFQLVDLTNNLVAAYTNTYPTIPLAALGNTTAVINNANYTFYRGIWVTNTGLGAASVTIQYVPQ